MGTDFGCLTGQEAAKRGYIPAKVFLDGVEVSKPVATVNDTEGWIEVYGTLGPKVERLYGDVVYIPNGSTRIQSRVRVSSRTPAGIYGYILDQGSGPSMKVRFDNGEVIGFDKYTCFDSIEVITPMHVHDWQIIIERTGAKISESEAETSSYGELYELCSTCKEERSYKRKRD